VKDKIKSWWSKFQERLQVGVGWLPVTISIIIMIIIIVIIIVSTALSDYGGRR
jgi:hypothetical protein